MLYFSSFFFFFFFPSFLPLLTSLLLFQTPAEAYKPLSDNFLRAIPSPGNDIDPQTGRLLAPILIPRVPGTPGQVTVQRHFVTYFQTELPKWTLEWHNSTARTPISGGAELPFANLVFKREPPWVKPGQANLLTLVAHYDSKYQPEGFVGATDSAAPCAMLLHVAKVVDAYLQRVYDEVQALGEGGNVETDMGIQILFLDGEEAFEKWTDSDSLYGSRALAKQWSQTPNPPSQKFHTYRTPLHQISLFLLLDLLGAPSPSIPSYFPTTHWAYKNLARIESRMRLLHLLESAPAHPFLADANMTAAMAMRGGGVADDHLPFMGGGVEILHVVPRPFPRVWHTLEDHGGNLDMATVRDWSRIVAVFALEWLDVGGVWEARRG
ncbi:hypothetical protein J1614_006104 [Plenodomus biglobosus]|nr:hypothetical protein J1614_006104 [Plenodomus biglobosus]